MNVGEENAEVKIIRKLQKQGALPIIRKCKDCGSGKYIFETSNAS